MTYIGAFIVFFTFIVKEGLGERWKKTAEAIETARHFQSLDKREHSGLTMMSRIQEDTSALREDIEKHWRPGRYSPSEPELIDELTVLRSTVLQPLESAKSLINVLPDQKVFKARLDSLEKSEDEINYDAFGIIANPGPSDVKRLLTLIAKTNDLYSPAQKLEDEVLAYADDVQSRNEHNSHFAWWIAAVLFALGWGLGLVGKLYGVPEAAGGE